MKLWDWLRGDKMQRLSPIAASFNTTVTTLDQEITESASDRARIEQMLHSHAESGTMIADIWGQREHDNDHS